jgi:hypothetical protein
MKRRRTAADTKLADDQKLLRWWKAWHREQRDAVLAGPHGPVLAELLRAIANLQHIQPAQLIGLVHAVDWAAIPYDARLVVLHELNDAITKYREKRGAEPIDDNLFDQPDTPYRVIRAIIYQVPATRGEASPELIWQISGEVT